MTYPLDVDPEEVLVRIIRTPQFFKNEKLRPNALRPQRGSARVSVVRWLHRERPGTAFKARCHLVGNVGQNAFCGVAVLTAQSCREANFDLEDDREAFLGHANIVYPFVVNDSEPVEGEAFVKQVEMANQILREARYVLDPEPVSPEWTIQSDLLPD